MTNDERNPKPEIRKTELYRVWFISTFDIRASFVIRHSSFELASSFDIRRSDFVICSGL